MPTLLKLLASLLSFINLIILHRIVPVKNHGCHPHAGTDHMTITLTYKLKVTLVTLGVMTLIKAENLAKAYGEQVLLPRLIFRSTQGNESDWSGGMVAELLSSAF